MADAGEGEELPSGMRLDELEIECVLGSGGFGVTYLARDLSWDAWRAVKEYLPREWRMQHSDGTVGPRMSTVIQNSPTRGHRKFPHPWLKTSIS